MGPKNLIFAIVVSVAAVMLESVEGIRAEYGYRLRVIEWTLTIFFTLEYLLRLICVAAPGAMRSASSASWTCSRPCRPGSASSFRALSPCW